MVTAVTIPKLGLTMRKATIVKWLKSEADEVKKGEAILLIETEKVSHRIEAPEQGVVLKIIAKPKTVVAVGAVIGYVGQPGESVPEVTVAGAPTLTVRSEAQQGIVTAPAVSSARPSTGPVRVSPRAKRLVTERGVDTANIVGTGPDGMIMENDVLKYVETTLYRTKQGLRVKEVIPLSPTRKAIAENLVSSLQSMAQVTLMTEADASNLQNFRSSLSQQEAGKRPSPTYTDILVKLVAGLIERQPIINSTLEDDQIKIVEDVNIGVAVALDTGLVVPVLRNANKKSLWEISSSLRELVEKAKAGNLGLDDVMGGTFTITNLGSYGIDAFTPIINPPQSAILGVGRIVEKPAVADGKVVPKALMALSLTFDHRVMDGHTAAMFLRKLKERVEAQNLNDALSV